MKTILGILDEIAALAPWLLLRGYCSALLLWQTRSNTKAGHHRADTSREARGEGKAGVYAVGCVIKQRMNHKSFHATTGVCLQRSQFEYWVQNKRVKWDDQNRANVHNNENR